MKIKICSRSQIEKISVTGFQPRTAVISITDMGEEAVKPVLQPDYILRLSFDDINSFSDAFDDSRKLAVNLFSREQADQLAKFVFCCKDNIDTLICQCRWGYSRSAAVASALEEYFYNSGMKIFMDERYYPNIYVFRQTLQALRRVSCAGFKKLKVSVFSREAVEELLQTGFPKHTAVISFYDPDSSYNRRSDYRPVDYSDKAARVFQISIYDIDLSVLPEFGLTYDTYFPEADALAEFIYSAREDGLDIICQCEYGQSRSSGCAAAIEEHFYHNGISVFADYRYYPNQVVYHKVFDALEKYKGKMTGDS